MGIGYLLRPSTPKGVVAVLVFGVIPFAWISGFFRQVDRAEAELRELKITKEYDGTSAPSKRSTEAPDHSSQKR